MRALLVSIALVGAITAARAAPAPKDPAVTPSADDGWKQATQRWLDAEHETDPARAPAAWRAAAEAFDAVVAAKTVDPQVHVESALAAVVAWQEASARDLSTRPLPPDDFERKDPPPARPLDADAQHLADAAGRYLALVGESGPEVAIVRLRRARAFLRFDHFAEAETDLDAILTHHSTDAIAEYAAQHLFDALSRQRRYDAMVTLAAALEQDTALMKRAPDLATLVARIGQQALRKQAEEAEQTGHYERCEAIYQQLYDADPKDRHADEVLYNASICAERAGSIGASLARLGQLVKISPRSQLAGHALVRIGMMNAAIAHFEDAAAAFEDFVRRFPAEREAVDLLSDAIVYRRALGQLEAAERDAALAVKLYGAKDRLVTLSISAALARDRLTRGGPGDRKAAARAVTELLSRTRVDLDPPAALALAELAWDASCPVAPTDGLCLAKGKIVARDRALADRARGRLRQLSPAPPRALRLQADDLLETALAIARSGDALDRAARAANTGYDLVLQNNTSDADSNIAVHAQRGRLAVHLARVSHGQTAGAQVELDACRGLAIRALSPTPWLASCDAQLAAIGAAPPRDHEQAPASPAGHVPIDLEPAAD